MDLNMDNKSEMINLIESLIGKDESESNSKYFGNYKLKLKIIRNMMKNSCKIQLKRIINIIIYLH